MKRLGIYLLFFLSGTAGLVYQVIWVRQFGNIFGNTVHSAALVTAVFMLGLGIGAYLAGWWGDQKHKEHRHPRVLLRTYAAFELGIGGLGLLVALLLPRIEPLSALISAYVQEANGWYSLSWSSYLFRYLAAVLLLLPITTLMGGTLTLLIRYLIQRDLSVAGWRVGALYGINTAGAAFGAFVVDFALVPSFGLLATQSLAVLLNLGVSLTAFRWAARPSVDRLAPAETGSAAASPERATALALTGVAILLSGFAAMGMEVIWFRFLSVVLGSYRGTFSLLLTVILAGIWLGSMAGGAAHRRLGHAAYLYIFAQGAFALTTLLFFLSYDGTLMGTAGTTRPLVETWIYLRPILWVVGIPAFVMGAAYPLANANIQRTAALVGRRAGLLYLANIAGAVAGALVAGFVLLPWLGLQSSILVLASCSVLPVVPLVLTVVPARHVETSSLRRRLAIGGAATIAVGMAVVVLVHWARLPAHHLSRLTYGQFRSQKERLLAFSEGVNESIMVTQNVADGTRRLYTNGHSMSATADGAQRYMRAFAHIPLLQIDRPQHVLVICFGVGNTLHAASLHESVKKLEVVELSRHVLEHARYFAKWNGDVLEDPRVSVYINDGRDHLRTRPTDHYDLVTLEPPPIVQAGVSALYSVEFYELVKSRLKPGGYLTQWLPVYQVPGQITAAIVRAFLDVFPRAVLLSGHRTDLILMGRKDLPMTIDPLRVVARLRAQPALWADLRRVNLGTPVELIGTFAGSSAALQETAGETPPVTDDLPAMEYCHTLSHQPLIPATLFDPRNASNWCPRCFVGGRPIDVLADLDTYIGFMHALYASPVFRADRVHRQRPTTSLVGATTESIARAYRRSRYLQEQFLPPRKPAGQ